MSQLSDNMCGSGISVVLYDKPKQIGATDCESYVIATATTLLHRVHSVILYTEFTLLATISQHYDLIQSHLLKTVI